MVVHGNVFVKVHKAYREVVAICDFELLGKKFEEGEIQLDINEHFYGGKEMSSKEALKLLIKKAKEDACFNFVGKRAVALGMEAGLIDKERLITVKGIPHALSLL